MQFKRLYTSGCSFTKHLPVPHKEQWTAHLGKMYKIPNVVNDGQGCGSNQRILRRLLQYIDSIPVIDLQQTLFIIQLTFPFRFEIHDSDQWTQCNEHNCVSADGQGDGEHALRVIELLKVYNSQEEDNLRFLQQCLAIEAVFKHYKIQNYFFITIWRMLDDRLRSIIDKEVKWLYNSSEDSWINSVKYDVVSDQDQHPSAMGNRQLAGWIAAGLEKDNIQIRS